MAAKQARSTQRVYVASSWRNKGPQQLVVHTLRAAGFGVYDFREPQRGVAGFSWREVDGGWENWSVPQYRQGLEHPVAVAAFERDMDALAVSDYVVLVMPAGRSACTEAAWAKGRGARVFVYIPQPMEPELMFKMFDGITDNMVELLGMLGVED